jgi:epoxide hydrolase-like predicted phosphatase
MLKAVIIDAGGVLIRSGQRVARQEWERAHHRPPGFLDRIEAEAIGPGWAGGRTEADIRNALLRLAEIPLADLERLLSVLSAHEALNEEVADLLRACRSRYATAVLANAGPGRRSELVTRFGVDSLVDLIVVSAEEGISKPAPELYRLTASRLGVDPDECVFIDDSPANVLGAEQVGMVGIHYRDTTSLIAALQHHVALDTGTETRT